MIGSFPDPFAGLGIGDQPVDREFSETPVFELQVVLPVPVGFPRLVRVRIHGTAEGGGYLEEQIGPRVEPVRRPALLHLPSHETIPTGDAWGGDKEVERVMPGPQHDTQGANYLVTGRIKQSYSLPQGILIGIQDALTGSINRDI
jgi:hypothetical protein